MWNKLKPNNDITGRRRGDAKLKKKKYRHVSTIQNATCPHMDSADLLLFEFGLVMFV